jgi:spore germination protein (amino acid permease)
VVLIRSFCNLLKTAFFPETPIDVLIATSFILIAVGAKKGLELFARITAFLGPIYLLSFIIIILSTVPLIKISNLKPILDKGAFPFLSGSPFILSFISICIIMGMFIPYCSNPNDGFKGKFIAVSLGSTLLGSEVIAAICIFGPEQSGTQRNIGLELSKLVSLGGRFEHLEAIFLMVAIAAGIMSSMSLIWAVSLGTSQIVGLSSYKPIVYPIALLAFVITVTSFDKSEDIYNFVNYVFPFIAMVVESGLECLLFAAALIFKKKGNKQTEPAGKN